MLNLLGNFKYISSFIIIKLMFISQQQERKRDYLWIYRINTCAPSRHIHTLACATDKHLGWRQMMIIQQVTIYLHEHRVSECACVSLPWGGARQSYLEREMNKSGVCEEELWGFSAWNIQWPLVHNLSMQISQEPFISCIQFWVYR